MIQYSTFSTPQYGTTAFWGSLLIFQMIALHVLFGGRSLMPLNLKLKLICGLITFILSWPYRQGFCYIQVKDYC